MEERRVGDKKLEELALAVTRVEVSLANIKEAREKTADETREYRKTLCGKLDRMNEKLDGLPCKVRIEQTKNITLQLKALWVLVTAAVLAIISEWVKLK